MSIDHYSLLQAHKVLTNFLGESALWEVVLGCVWYYLFVQEQLRYELFEL